MFAEHCALRRFHCAVDFGRDPRSRRPKRHSKRLIETARESGFDVVTKRVKYINDPEQPSGYLAKCDQDVDIVTDLFQHRDAYDRIVLFSGDGDFVPALAHLHKSGGKESVVVSAREACAFEVVDAHANGITSAVIYAEDLKHALKS